MQMFLLLGKYKEENELDPSHLIHSSFSASTSNRIIGTWIFP